MCFIKTFLIIIYDMLQLLVDFFRMLEGETKSIYFKFGILYWNYKSITL